MYLDIVQQIKEVGRLADGQRPDTLPDVLGPLRTDGASKLDPPMATRQLEALVRPELLPSHRPASYFRMLTDPVPDGDRADLSGPDLLQGHSQLLSCRREK